MDSVDLYHNNEIFLHCYTFPILGKAILFFLNDTKSFILIALTIGIHHPLDSLLCFRGERKNLLGTDMVFVECAFEMRTKECHNGHYNFLILYVKYCHNR